MNKNICSICQECFPTVEIDRIEEGMTGREVANLLYNNFDKLNKSKADICTKHELDKMLRDQYHIYNDVARQKFIDEVFYTFAKQDVKDSLSDFKELKDIIHDHLVDYTNPHRVTKDQVGLDQVDNTSDKDKPISDAVAKAIDELYEAIDNVDEREINYTINGYKINTNPILDGNDIELDNYTKVSVDTAIGNDDTVTKAIGKLEYRLEEEVDYRVDALEQEIAARIAADEALSNDITEETHNRIDEDNKLQQNITDLDSKYKGVTDGIKDDLQQHITEANAALNAEQQARQEADTKLQNNIDTESSARQEADKQLQQNIDNLNASLTEDIENVSNDLSTHINDKNNPHEVTKEQVGLGNLTNDVQVKRSEMGVANGVATLNESGQVPSSQLPSYVDDVLEYNTFSSLPEAGETGKIYVTLDDNLTYRWSGTQYVEVSKSLALGETSSTAFPGDRGKTVEDRFDSLPSNIISGWSDAPVTANTDSVTLQIGGEYKASGNYDANFSDDAILPSATTTTAGVMSASDKSKLDQLTEGLSDDTPSMSEVVENINAITQNITDIQGDITDIENSIGDTSNLTTEATNLTDAINEHETQIDTISNDVTDIQNNLDQFDNKYLPLIGGTIQDSDGQIALNLSPDNGITIKYTVNDNQSSLRIDYSGITLKDKTTNDLLNAAGSTSALKTINGESLLGDGNIEIIPSYDVATTTEDGLMSSEDKTKLDKIVDTGDGTQFLSDNGTYKTIDLTSLDDKYVSVNNIKTINGESIIGTGDITISTESGIEDAPSDGKQYVRQNGAWVEVSFDTTELLNRVQALEQALTLKNI